EEAFAALPSKIDGIKAFEWGTNNSPEKNDDGFTHGFMETFDSEAGREQYLPHPDHKAFVEVLLPVLDKVRVLDFWDGRIGVEKREWIP
ncbi:MAG: Dabb family protein, partial [Planctomycetaceae bacterium]